MERNKVRVGNTMSNDPIEDIKDTFIKNILNDIKSDSIQIKSDSIQIKSADSFPTWRLGMMRTHRWIELSQEGDCGGIKPGDKFTSNGVEEMVIGFTNDQNKAEHQFSQIWTLTKGDNAVGFWNKGC